MRRAALASWVIAGLALPGAAFGQSMLGNASGDSTDQNTVAVPPAPPIVSAPLSAPMPQVVTPQPAPPGLVQTPVPPANADNGQNPPDGTAVDNGAPAAPTPVTPDASQTAPVTPGQTAPAVTTPTPAPNTASSTPPPAANDWVPQHTARIGLLDKVDGGASTVSIPVGGQTDAGDLQISVLACETRPPGEIPDDAIFVSIQPVATGATGTASAAPPPGGTPADATASGGPAPPGQGDGTQAGSASGAPIFRGWMVRSIPGATVVGDASETLRVVSCS
jgi:hypothetical protein